MSDDSMDYNSGSGDGGSSADTQAQASDPSQNSSPSDTSSQSCQQTDDTPTPQIQSYDPDQGGYSPTHPYGPNWSPTDHGYAYTPECEADSHLGAFAEEGVIKASEVAVKGTRELLNPLTLPLLAMDLETQLPDDPRLNAQGGYCSEDGNYHTPAPGGEYPPYKPDQGGYPPPTDCRTSE